MLERAAATKNRVLSRVGPALLLTLSCLPAGGAEVTKDAAGRVVLLSRDASGRVQSRRVLSADGSRVATMTDYWPHSGVARRSVEEAVDPAGRPTRRTVQEFDQRGRLLERRAVSIDTTGKERGTRTRYTYDPRGQGSATTSPVEP